MPEHHIKVKIIEMWDSIRDFEEEINDFLKQIPIENVVEIKYFPNIEVENDNYLYTAMIIYKD